MSGLEILPSCKETTYVHNHNTRCTLQIPGGGLAKGVPAQGLISLHGEPTLLLCEGIEGGRSTGRSTDRDAACTNISGLQLLE